MQSDIYCQVAPEKIDMLTKLIEAYDHLGIVSTLDRDKGMVIVRGTENTFPEMKKILSTMPFPVEIINSPV